MRTGAGSTDFIVVALAGADAIPAITADNAGIAAGAATPVL
ncbi:MAG TPA: hypothetical protein VH475_01270 [Tepidisphaeraceae bacterium]